MDKWSEIKLDNFNGPLDLLLHLIKEKDMDLLEINLVDVTNQYLDYIKQWEVLNIEIASEYLVTASYLVELKSKMLIPKQEVEIQDNYENEVDDLVNRLIEYHKIKEAAEYFKNQQKTYFDTFSKEKSVIRVEKIDEDDLPLAENSIDIDKFAKIFLKVIEKNKLKNKETTNINDKEISPEEISKEIVDLLETYADTKTTWTLVELLDKKGVNLQMMLAMFLAILDLAKNAIIHIEQNDKDIIIHKIKGE